VCGRGNPGRLGQAGEGFGRGKPAGDARQAIGLGGEVARASGVYAEPSTLQASTRQARTARDL
jgi:hypothetical protein